MARGKRVEIIKIIVDGAEVDAKACTKCCEVKALMEFYVSNNGKGGRTSKCVTCLCNESAQWRKDNPQKHARIQRDYYHRNPRCQKRYNALYRHRYPDKRKAYDANRFAVKKGLPAQQCITKLLGACALTQSKTGITLEHWIPISIGHGGTVLGNVYSMVGYLNCSKQKTNPFEWFEANRQRFELDESRFDMLVWRLATENGLTAEEFRRFTYWCFDNPRTNKQIMADNIRFGYKKPSIELWREKVGLAFPIRVDFDNYSLNNLYTPIGEGAA